MPCNIKRHKPGDLIRTTVMGDLQPTIYRVLGYEKGEIAGMEFDMVLFENIKTGKKGRIINQCAFPLDCGIPIKGMRMVEI